MYRKFVTSLLLVATCISLNAAPYRIIVVSSGEETSTNMLTDSGQKRASALVGYFLGIPPNTAPLFDDLVTTNPKTAPVHPIAYVGAPSILSAIQTIAPLANAIFPKLASVTVFTNMPESVKQYVPQKLSRLKSELYSNRQYDGKTAVICCKDQDIASLLIELEPRLQKNAVFQKSFPTDHAHNQFFVITYQQDTPSFNILTIH